MFKYISTVKQVQLHLCTAQHACTYTNSFVLIRNHEPVTDTQYTTLLLLQINGKNDCCCRN